MCFLKWGYCKHILATIDKFGLTSKRLGRGKFANHTNQRKGRKPTNTPALQLDPPNHAQSAITRANVPVLTVDASNRSECPDGWMNGSDCDSDITGES